VGNDCKWFVAQAIFQATVHSDEANARALTEDLLFLVQAVDHPAAVTRAEVLARAKEHSYENEKGQRVSWSFVRLVELTEMIDQQFDEGAELKSTMTEVEPTVRPRAAIRDAHGGDA
jgi:hypothetical protein